MFEITNTPKQIAQCYSSAMDSVMLINVLKAKTQPLSVEDADMLTRNKEHLLTILAKTFWTTEDLKPFQAAVL